MAFACQNTTLKKAGHTVMSEDVKGMVYQWSGDKQSLGLSAFDFLHELQGANLLAGVALFSYNATCMKREPTSRENM